MQQDPDFNSTETNPSAPLQTPRTEPRSVQLVNFLEALAALRKKTQPDVLKYEECLWLAEVPREPECYSKNWDGRDEQAEDGDSDLWLEVKHRAPPKPPEWPEECKRWLSTWDPSQAPEPPRLLDTIAGVDLDEDNELDNGAAGELSILILDDHPTIIKCWEHFVSGPWSAWRDTYGKWKSIHDVYVKLFRIYSKLKKDAEQLELLLAGR